MRPHDERRRVYCSVCALDALKQQFRKGPGTSPPEFQVVSAGEVQDLGDNFWQVSRAHVVFDGASLCMFHMGAALAEEFGDAQS